MMKGDIVLEYPFNVFLYTVVVLVVIGMILTLSHTSISLCQFTPQGCGKQDTCVTLEATESTINEAILRKYCDSCWRKTGNVDYKQDCLCSIVSGTFSPISFNYTNCELQCNKVVTSIKFSYDHTIKKVYIKC